MIVPREVGKGGGKSAANQGSVWLCGVSWIVSGVMVASAAEGIRS